MPLRQGVREAATALPSPVSAGSGSKGLLNLAQVDVADGDRSARPDAPGGNLMIGRWRAGR
jgi:hypothetical protein